MARGRQILTALGVLSGLYAAFCVAVWTGQRRLIYPAPRDGHEPEVTGGSLKKLEGPHGRTVYALYVPPDDQGRVIVHFHGNGEQLSDTVPLAWAFRRAGFGFFAVEYPGYGLASEYSPSEERLYSDAETALWHLHNGLSVPPERTVLVGQSLGAGVATEMAVRGHGARLVLISPFTSMRAMAASLVPVLPVGFLIHEHFDTESKAKGVALPVLVIHGVDDELVPVAMGRRLVEVFPNATGYWVSEGHHNDLFVRDGKLLVDKIAQFSRGELLP